jgi:hypothetical protein
MDREKRLELLLKARNLLHKQESGQKLTDNEIIFAHDYVDMVIDDMVAEPTMKIFRVFLMYGQEVYSARSAQELCVYLNTHKEDLWIDNPVSLEDIEEVQLSPSSRINYLGGHRE